MKKLNKFFAVLVALAMMAMLSVTAFAAETWQTDVGEYSTSLENSVLTKVFDVPDGVTAPEATFKFDFAPDAANPTGPTDTVTQEIAMATGTGTQTKNLHFNTFIGLKDATKAINLTQPGEYVFTVSEQQNTYTLKTGEKVTYDTGSYKLRIYVVNKEVPVEEGSEETTTVLAIKAITVAPLTTTTTPAAEEGGAPTTTTTEGNKVKPEDQTPEGKDETKQDECVGSGFKFTNYYTKNVTDNSDDGAFHIQKLVTKSGDTSKQYDFDVTITVDPQTVAEYAAKEGENAGKYTLTAGGKNWTFDKDHLAVTVTGIKLAANDKLVFNTFPAGATVQVKENLKSDTTIQNAAKYTKSVAANQIELAEGAATSFDKDTDVDVTTAAYNQKSNVKVTNTLDDKDITPTGILISNIPYIALALVAIGGLVAYVVVRRRQSDEA